MPPSFGPHGGEIWMADEVGNAVHTVGLPPTYTVTNNFLSSSYRGRRLRCPGPSVHLLRKTLPSAWRNNSSSNSSGLYPLTDFAGLGGKVILTSESGGDFADTVLVTFGGAQLC